MKILTKHPLGREKYRQAKIRNAEEGYLVSSAKQGTHSHRIVQAAEQELK